MVGAAAELSARARALNTERMAVFGGGELELAGPVRLHTEAPCVARDIVRVGELLLLGRESESGLTPETGLTEVLTLYRRDGEGYREQPPEALPGLLDDARFQRDFAELCRYFRGARLLRLRLVGSLLLAVFRTGDRAADIRVLRWRFAADGGVEYVDAKGERDHRLPEPYEEPWTPTGREDHADGRHPHVLVDGALRVDTLEGTLSVRSAEGPEPGVELYSEPVDEPLQSLADAEVGYVRVGPLLLLRVLPYNETVARYLVWNERTGEVVRLDGLGRSWRRLPEDQGVVFPGGYYLTTAPAGRAAKTFATDTEGLAYERTVRSPNGEDVLHVFQAPAGGHTLLLPYNLIREEVSSPLPARGHTLFEDGTLVVLRAGEGPARVHQLQVWRTPFVSDSHAAAVPAGEGPLARVGNAELVRGVSDCLAVARMADGMEPNGTVFRAITAACERVRDLHHWLPDGGLGGLDGPLEVLRATAEQVIEEFQRVEEARARDSAALDEAEREVTALVRRARGEVPGGAAGWVALLTELRRARGGAESLRELRHADPERITRLTGELTESLAATGRRAVAFLAREDAFDTTRAGIAGLEERAARATTVAETEPLDAELTEHAEGLRTVTEVVGGLDIADATVRTGLLERVGEVTGAVNRARAVLDGRRAELRDAEGRAEFAAEVALLGQAVAGALAAASGPEECDEQLGRLLIQLENLESRFSAFDDFLAQLADRREEIYETFAARKQARLDERARHAERLAGSAERVLGTVTRRSAALDTLDEVNAYFSTDPLVEKVQATAGELRDLGDTVRAEELEGRLKAARQEAARALRDRADLYDAEGTVRLGRHRFGVTGESVGLTLVPQDGELVFAVTGTDYRAPVRDAEFAATRDFWDQPLVSESPAVYRAEHLAATVLQAAVEGRDGLTLDGLRAAASSDGGELLGLVREMAEAAYDEGYDRGVHDHDAARVLECVLRLRDGAGLLRFAPRARAAAQLFWAFGTDAATRNGWAVRARSLGRARSAFGGTAEAARLAGELGEAAGRFLASFPGTAEDPADGGESGDPLRSPPGTAGEAGEYLFEELVLGGPRFATGAAARALLDDFTTALGGAGSAEAKELAEDLAALDADLGARAQLLGGWLSGYAASRELGGESAAALPEAAAIRLCGEAVDRRDTPAPLSAAVTGLLGTHPRVERGELPLRLDEFLARTREFRTCRVPAHRAYTRRRNALLEAERERLDLERYLPRVMPAFVRNRLIDEVYLPLIGDNLAKQLGTAGEERRTDSQGLLLLLSPPGYGKTTLMEYVAARLGLVFVTVDGPALGHRTTSLDPAAAPDAAARREVQKINFALEMGNNVLLHLDDVQHTSPELLQKFIPLCDAQRRIDGVGSDGRPRGYDLRGKRFAVCMAGNPFTESGSRFRVPDMLANRADVWNLGDVLSGREELFRLSHIENALTSNPVLAPLTAWERADVDLLVRMAREEPGARADQLSRPFPPAERERVLAVLRGLLEVVETVLRVNAAYIASATRDEATRREPPFLLQGSYRNTNQLAERISPVLNAEELAALVDDHYQAEAQTLTTGAEANLLRLALLRGRATPEQEARWAELTEPYRR
ncbi:DNA repair ATPase [Streptomyces sp. AJS327]|uniref:DNA repair ATPase n=1 Tax=Streptomyces sp. AJS327 TaxID=2545265 RepID=UPI0015DE6830|nr:DNA repair ATPase [Streptomyces sp. AJS327]MBA0049718.1 DNA repair ATPase [Streptomyces sp. AJS327]